MFKTRTKPEQVKTVKDEKKYMQEFDWFLFENRVRDIVKAEVSPVYDKFSFYKDQISELRQKDLDFSRHLDELEFIVHKAR